MKKEKLRRTGDILLDLEPLLLELLVDHDMQWGDVLSLVHGYMMIHAPHAREEYVEGGNPVFFYGPKEGLK